MTTAAAIDFAKGHGTGNDFVLLPDDLGQLDLTAERVQRICDRHRGIGADGILRVMRTASSADPAIAAMATEAEWFMDYRNADGTTAEMCGNGVRVFAHFLRSSGRSVADEIAVATRGGVKLVRRDPAGYAVSMGRPVGNDIELAVRTNGRSWPAVAVALPNPHAVAFVDKLADVGPLLEQPVASPVDFYPNGANFEFVEQLADRMLRMRVHERGVGETQSCGTGACAVAWAARRRQGVAANTETEYQVDVPGGTVWVRESADGDVILRGPAEIVAIGTLAESFWR